MNTQSKHVEYSYFDNKENKTLYSSIDIDAPNDEAGNTDDHYIDSRLPDFVQKKWADINYTHGDLYSVCVIAIYPNY